MARFDYNPAGLQRVLASQRLLRVLRARATAGMRYARRLAPVRTGRYRASFRVVSGTRNGVVYARLLNSAPYAVYLEFGTRYMRRQRVLGRAMDAMRADLR